jgi:hypothetical protein
MGVGSPIGLSFVNPHLVGFVADALLSRMSIHLVFLS